MKNTEEQDAIIEASRFERSLVVNALAGSGKTSTAIECVGANHRSCRRMIYLSFNRSVALTMREKLAKKGVRGPEITTLHSLAFRRLGARMLDSGRELGVLKPYALSGVADAFFRTEGGSQVRDEYALNRCRRLALDRMEAWCGSADLDMDVFLARSHPVSFLAAAKACGIAAESIDAAAKKLWETISETNALPLTHAVYLKLFHLKCAKDPRMLAYDLAIVDEAQDLFPVTEALVRLMRDAGARIILFGDRYQQIYTWTGSVNSIQRFEDSSRVLSLTQSFRCPGGVVREAEKYLRLLGFTGTFRPAPAPCVLDYKTPIIISRTNSSLFANIPGSELPTRKIHLVGGVDSYNFDAIGDYLNFLSGHRERIKNPVVAGMDGQNEYDEYAEAVNDVEMRNARTVVQRLGPGKVWGILEAARRKEFAEKPSEAELCLSTGHKCKGSEFETVLADPSFMDLWKDANALSDSPSPDPERERILGEAGAPETAHIVSSEELRLAYVTLTRATRELRPGPLFLDDMAAAELLSYIAEKKLVLTDLDQYGDVHPVMPPERPCRAPAPGSRDLA